MSHAMQATRIQRAWKKSPRVSVAFQKFIDLNLTKDAVTALKCVLSVIFVFIS